VQCYDLKGESIFCKIKEMLVKGNFHLDCCNITKSFLVNNQMYHVLKNITYRFEQGKTYALMGASGSGKSTLIHILAQIDEPSSGSLVLTHFARHECAIVFQCPYLIKELTVLENIVLAGTIAGKSKKESEQEAQKLLTAVGLQETGSWSVGMLSGGQKQRVSLARALLNKPKFLYADEITGNLDFKTGNIILDLLFEFQKKWNMTLILSTHNEKIAERMEVVLILRDGTLIQDKNENNKMVKGAI
jgi:ABC-type lipoprotein export system ATPase subunit